MLNSEQGGIVAFVTNGGFIDSNAFDGFRKSVAEEFHSVYCYNLRVTMLEHLEIQDSVAKKRCKFLLQVAVLELQS